jgi:hypothetical protein
MQGKDVWYGRGEMRPRASGVEESELRQLRQCSQLFEKWVVKPILLVRPIVFMRSHNKPILLHDFVSGLRVV